MIFELDVRGNARGPGGLCQVNETLRVTVNVSDWARVLKEAGAADVLLVGVHLPTDSSGSPARAAFELVRKANEHVVHGHYTAAVAECRRAIESLWKSAKLTDDARAARKLLATMGEQMTMTKRERELALGEAIRVFTHVAHHVGADAEPEVFGRLDAAMTVATTAGLISSLSAQPDLVSGRSRPDSRVSPAPVVSPQAMFDKVVERLRTNSANRPKTAKKLRSSFETMVGRSLSEKEADALVNELNSRGIVSEVAGKLVYRSDI